MIAQILRKIVKKLLNVKSEIIDTPDQNLKNIDIIVEEKATGEILVGAGVGSEGGTAQFSVSENNFLGTGKQVGIGINKSTYQSSLNFSYTEPYFTADGVSAGYSIFARETDYSRLRLQPFSQNTRGANLNWSYPITEIQRIGFGIGYEYLELNLGDYVSSQIIEDFVSANGNWFKSANFNLNWVKSTLNRGIFATRGTSQRLGLDLSMPGSGLEYYKVTYKGSHLRGLGKQLSLKLRADLVYGESYGDTTQMPFFKNFYSGGLGSVRGYKKYTLGPRNSPQGGFYSYSRPTGGNVQIVLGAEVIFPLPFVKDQRSLQSSLFFDAGNIFNTKCGNSEINCFNPKEGELRYSVGVGATWLSGFGPITFSIAKPLLKGASLETHVAYIDYAVSVKTPIGISLGPIFTSIGFEYVHYSFEKPLTPDNQLATADTISFFGNAYATALYFDLYKLIKIHTNIRKKLFIKTLH